MSLCTMCGLQTSGDAALCPHHHAVYGDEWANGNRIMCDFFHRQKVPARLSQPQLHEEYGGDYAQPSDAQPIPSDPPPPRPKRYTVMVDPRTNRPPLAAKTTTKKRRLNQR